MGLDNGIVLKILKEDVRAKCPELHYDLVSKSVWTCDELQYSEERTSYEIVYFRKCWGIRDEFIKCLQGDDDTYEYILDNDSIAKFISILEKYTNKEYYDVHADSIWEYENICDTLFEAIDKLKWLLSCKMELESNNINYKIYFYDSY